MENRVKYMLLEFPVQLSLYTSMKWRLISSNLLLLGTRKTNLLTVEETLSSRFDRVCFMFQNGLARCNFVASKPFVATIAQHCTVAVGDLNEQQ